MTIESTNTHPTTTYDPMRGTTTMPELEPPEREIPIQALDRAIKTLDIKIAKLNEAINPVVAGTVKEAKTEIGKTLQELTHKIQVQTTKIDDNLERLEL